MKHFKQLSTVGWFVLYNILHLIVESNPDDGDSIVEDEAEEEAGGRPVESVDVRGLRGEDGAGDDDADQGEDGDSVEPGGAVADAGQPRLQQLGRNGRGCLGFLSVESDLEE